MSHVVYFLTMCPLPPLSHQSHNPGTNKTISVKTVAVNRDHSKTSVFLQFVEPFTNIYTTLMQNFLARPSCDANHK